MRVLFLAHRIPYPPNKGDKIRAYHELTGLAERGHEIHLLTFADDPQDIRPEYESALLQTCAAITVVPLNKRVAALRALGFLARREPLSVGYFSSARMRRAVRRATTTFAPDAFVIYSSSMVQYVPRQFVGRTVVDLVDVDSEKWRDYARSTVPPFAWIYRIEAARLFAYERTIIAQFAQTVVTTGREAALLGGGERSSNGSRLHSLKNGVDWRSFSLDAVDELRQAVPPAERHFLPTASVPVLVFTGAMDYYANADGMRYFVTEVLPLVRARHADARLLIVGSNPSTMVKRLGDYPGVTVTGSVVDVRPYLAAATVCVAPLRIARGIQNKVIEAMAMGRAVVATPEAVAGLSATSGEDLLVGHSRDEFAALVSQVIDDERLRARLGRRARQFVQREHNWEPMLQRFSELVVSVGSPVPRLC